MSPADIRTDGSNLWLRLPSGFADAAITVEVVSDTELRVQKVAAPSDPVPPLDVPLAPLSDRDRDFFLALIDNPPEPTPAFLAAAARYKARHG